MNRKQYSEEESNEEMCLPFCGYIKDWQRNCTEKNIKKQIAVGKIWAKMTVINVLKRLQNAGNPVKLFKPKPGKTQ